MSSHRANIPNVLSDPQMYQMARDHPIANFTKLEHDACSTIEQWIGFKPTRDMLTDVRATKLQKIAAKSYLRGDKSVPPVCLLCWRNDEWLLRPLGPLLWSTTFPDFVAFHSNCLSLCTGPQAAKPPTSFEIDVLDGYSLTDVMGYYKARKDCYKCGLPSLARCAHEGCTKRFHIMCVEFGECFYFYADEFPCYCGEHFTLKLQQSIYSKIISLSHNDRNHKKLFGAKLSKQFEANCAAGNHCQMNSSVVSFDPKSTNTMKNVVFTVCCDVLVYHRNCIRQFAYQRFSSLSCPSCKRWNLDTLFHHTLGRQGIFVNNVWKTTQYCLYGDPMTNKCLCPHDIAFFITGRASIFNRIGCSQCGRASAHLLCIQFHTSSNTNTFICASCLEALGRKRKLDAPSSSRMSFLAKPDKSDGSNEEGGKKQVLNPKKPFIQVAGTSSNLACSSKCKIPPMRNINTEGRPLTPIKNPYAVSSHEVKKAPVVAHLSAPPRHDAGTVSETLVTSAGSQVNLNKKPYVLMTNVNQVAQCGTHQSTTTLSDTTSFHIPTAATKGTGTLKGTSDGYEVNIVDNNRVQPSTPTPTSVTSSSQSPTAMTPTFGIMNATLDGNRVHTVENAHAASSRDDKASPVVRHQSTSVTNTSETMNCESAGNSANSIKKPYVLMTNVNQVAQCGTHQSTTTLSDTTSLHIPTALTIGTGTLKGTSDGYEVNIVDNNREQPSTPTPTSVTSSSQSPTAMTPTFGIMNAALDGNRVHTVENAHAASSRDDNASPVVGHQSTSVTNTSETMNCESAGSSANSIKKPYVLMTSVNQSAQCETRQSTTILSCTTLQIPTASTKGIGTMKDTSDGRKVNIVNNNRIKPSQLIWRLNDAIDSDMLNIFKNPYSIPSHANILTSSGIRESTPALQASRKGTATGYTDANCGDANKNPKTPSRNDDQMGTRQLPSALSDGSSSHSPTARGKNLFE